jgi:hypothetical protein
MGFDLNKWFSSKCEGFIIYSYSGSITHGSINEALKAIENSLSLIEQDIKLKRKVFSVFVESIQNLFHHVVNPPKNADNDLADNFGAIVLSRVTNLSYYITTGNFVKNDGIDGVKTRIDQVNALNEEELKMVYRDVLLNKEISPKGGGGLGIIDIARKSGNSIGYKIYPFDDEYVFFELDINIR